MNEQELMESVTATKPILPGATIGMVGGGQLGRMFAIAAAQLGYHVVVFCEDENSPAAQVAHSTVVGTMKDHAAVDRFASRCDVITLEFENIPAETIARCNQFAPTYPAASVLAIAQDRAIEKSTLRDAGLPVTPFAEVHDAESLCRIGDTLGWPMIVKTARSGYDGKGQFRVNAATDATTVPWKQADRWVAEKCISFDREVSVIVARTLDGRCKCFPVFENVHRNHILDLSVSPSELTRADAMRAAEIATIAAQTLGVVGLLCVEMFVVQSDRGKIDAEADLLINEVAPRPHNSGHLTIEACQTSQFEQHVRAICGLPLGETAMLVGAGAMVNLLGDLWQSHHGSPPWEKALAIEGVRLHLYGKSEAAIGRKMGHITATGATVGQASERVRLAREALG